MGRARQWEKNPRRVIERDNPHSYSLIKRWITADSEEEFANTLIDSIN
jgi:hypothetical protein